MTSDRYGALSLKNADHLNRNPLFRGHHLPVYSARLDDVESIIGDLRSTYPGHLVFTNGVFDILHRGHTACLDAARASGQLLVVGVNSDASVRMLGKGSDRPFIDERSRANVVAALRSVDAVFVFDNKTPIDLLKRVRPDIYVKGGDYDVSVLEETSLVESWGGCAIAIPIEYELSTTRIAANIRRTTGSG